MSPTLRTTRGLTGHRPIGGHLDGHELVSVFGALNRITGQVTTRLVERPRASGQRQKPTSGQRCWHERCARHVRDSARASPATQYPRGVLVSDHAPWHRGALMTEVRKEWPHLERSRWPSYRPHLQLIERFWQVVRRRAPHHRLVRALGQLKQTWRHSRCDDQPLRPRVRSLIPSPKKWTKLSAA